MLELKLEKTAKILLYAVPFLVLLFIEGFYFPFIITRTVFFRLLLELALFIYLLLLALNWEKYRPRFNWAMTLVLIFLLVEFIAAVFGYDFYKSFWSDFERMEGVVSLVYLAAYLFLLLAFFKEKKDWLFYIRLILFSSLAVSLYGLGQKYNILPVFEAGINRATSTIGNAAFLAGYLLMALGLAVYYYFNEANKNYRYFVLAASGVNLIVLLLTLTRGAILGLVLGVLFLFLLNAFFLKGRVRRNSLIILAIIGILVFTFLFFRSQLADSKIEVIRRMATISLKEGTALNRLLVWSFALKDFPNHPILGIGAENFEVIYNKYYTPDISENWFDRTHNVYLDRLSASGLLGLAAFLAILFYLFYLLFKKRKSDYWQFATLSSLLIAYAIHNFFVFDTINTSFLYFFLIGLIGFKEAGMVIEAREAQPSIRLFNKIFIILLIANIFVFYKLIYLPLRINRAIFVGYYYALADTFRSYENFKYALGHKFGSVEAAVQLNKMNEVLLQEGHPNAQVRSQYLALTKEKLRFASDNFPYDIKTKMYLGQLILNTYQDKQELSEAESLLKESIRLSPTRAESYYLLYNLYGKLGKKAEARALLEDLRSKLPDYGSVKIMLASDLAKDDPARAEEFLEQGIKQYGYGDFGGLTKIISYLLDQKRYAETVPYYQKFLTSAPERYDYRLDLAKVYYLTNDFEAAREQINIISANSPETLNGYEEFVKMAEEAGNKK